MHTRPSESWAASEGEGGRGVSGGCHHAYLFIETRGALGVLFLLFPPKPQQLETVLANSPSCEIRRA